MIPSIILLSVALFVSLAINYAQFLNCKSQKEFKRRYKEVADDAHEHLDKYAMYYKHLKKKCEADPEIVTVIENGEITTRAIR